MRRPIVAGNWKMNLGCDEATRLIEQLKTACKTTTVDVVVCPAFTALSTVSELLKESSIGLGAQDIYWEKEGAYTGEISPLMLRDIGCRYVIIGHSERRKYFAETNETVNKKLQAALANGFIPIVCIGETLDEREGGKTFDVLTEQLRGSLGECSTDTCGKLIIAYEPVWAIGTGKTASPEQVQEAHQFIRQWVSKKSGEQDAAKIRIQYGGSVNAGNAATLLGLPDVDGALVGGASLKPDAFSAIISAAEQAQDTTTSPTQKQAAS